MARNRNRNNESNEGNSDQQQNQQNDQNRSNQNQNDSRQRGQNQNRETSQEYDRETMTSSQEGLGMEEDSSENEDSESRKTTTDHDTIKEWAEQHGGRPTRVKGTDIVNITFPGSSEDNLEDVSWSEFFVAFDDNNLALMYEENGNFNQLVDRGQQGSQANQATA